VAKKKAFGKLANDAPRNTRRRRAKAAQKPNKKKRSHIPETKKSTMMPTVMSATHNKREYTDKAEQRLNLKTGSVFTLPECMMASDAKVRANKVAPRINPRERPYDCVNLNLV
jgi:hypothetical protein